MPSSPVLPGPRPFKPACGGWIPLGGTIVSLLSWCSPVSTSAPQAENTGSNPVESTSSWIASSTRFPSPGCSPGGQGSNPWRSATSFGPHAPGWGTGLISQGESTPGSTPGGIIMGERLPASHRAPTTCCRVAKTVRRSVLSREMRGFDSYRGNHIDGEADRVGGELQPRLRQGSTPCAVFFGRWANLVSHRVRSAADVSSNLALPTISRVMRAPRLGGCGLEPQAAGLDTLALRHLLRCVADGEAPGSYPGINAGSSPVAATSFGTWRSLGSAPARGAGGRWFEPSRPDHFVDLRGGRLRRQCAGRERGEPRSPRAGAGGAGVACVSVDTLSEVLMRWRLQAGRSNDGRP